MPQLTEREKEIAAGELSTFEDIKLEYGFGVDDEEVDEEFEEDFEDDFEGTEEDDVF